jgi:hypothetical protein
LEICVAVLSTPIIRQGVVRVVLALSCESCFAVVFCLNILGYSGLAFNLALPLFSQPRLASVS